ncbi:SdrD B-like domain-containing protein [Tautonia marina]|uniref:SdrD B-like domain-containing protein n=1 Tax=Tautonia marina TaxID=2653855 RepID=UPI0013756B9C|nr:SdrD B-like domain-containing protein [Tautonia marina]
MERLEDRTLLSQIFGQLFEDMDGDGLRDVGEVGIEGVEVQLLKFNIVDGSTEPYRTTISDTQGRYSFGNDGQPVPVGDYQLQIAPEAADAVQTYPMVEHAARPYFLRIDSANQTIGAWSDTPLTDPTEGWIDEIPTSGPESTQSYFMNGDFLFQFGPQGIGPSRVSFSGMATVVTTASPGGDADGNGLADVTATMTELTLNGILRSDQHEAGYQGPISLTLRETPASTGLVEARQDTPLLADGSFDLYVSIDVPDDWPNVTSPLINESAIGFLAREIARFPAFGHVYEQRGTEPPVVLFNEAGEQQGELFFSSMTPTPGADFGVFRLGAIEGQKFEDINGDGVFDEGEPGLEGWEIVIESLGTELDTEDGGSPGGGQAGPPPGHGHAPSGPVTVTTGADGSYVLEGLGPGYYKVTESVALPWVQTLPGAPDFSYTILLTSGGTEILNFGNVLQLGGFDYGDAPESYGTLLADDGPRHEIVSALRLGGSVDPEEDGQPDGQALGDDLDGNDDEDGVNFTSALVAGRVNTIIVNASGAGNLSAWLDLDGNGVFDPTDQVLTDEPLVAGDNEVDLDLTAIGELEEGVDTFARFRFSTDAGLGPLGEASDGEVEDYAVTIYAASDVGIIIGQVFEDFDGDGLRDPTEVGLNDWTVELVTLDGVVVASTISATDGDNDGMYSFVDVIPGTYEIRQVAPEGDVTWLQTYPGGESGAVSYFIDVVPGQIGSAPYVDAESDGTATWLADLGPATDTFPLLAQFSLLSGGGGAGHGGDPLNLTLFGTGVVERFAATDEDGDGTAETVPATFQSLELSGYVMVGGHEGTPGEIMGPVTVRLLQPADGQFGGSSEHGEEETEDGAIPVSFSMLLEIDLTALGMGVYTSSGTPVSFDGGVLQIPYVGTDIAHEGGGPPIQFNDGAGSIYRLVAGHLMPAYGLDFGNFADVSVSGTVFDDYDLDGVQGLDEPGLAGVTVMVQLAVEESEHGSGGGGGGHGGGGSAGGHEETEPTVFLTLTDANGMWSLANLGPGTYTIQIIPPGAYVPSSGDPNDLLTTVTFASGDVITEINGALAQFDYGDAPDPTYPTLIASDGASHVVTGNFQLGELIDGELDGQPTVGADGDPSDDGVTFSSTVLRPGQETTLTVLVSLAGGTGFLDAWVDFNADGDWDDLGEQILVSQEVVEGENLLPFTVPVDASAGATTYARFRLSRTGELTPTGDGAAGEVEDYLLTINAAPVAADMSFSVAEDTTLEVAAPGVLADASDVEGDLLTVILVTGPAHGTLQLNPDGSFSYEPDADFFGADSFVFIVSDGTAESAPATATIDVLAVPDDPTATLSNNGPVDEGSPVTVEFTDPLDPDDPAAEFRYSFALTPAGLASSFGEASADASTMFTFGDDGTYTVFARIFDSNGGSTDAQTMVTVLDVAPTITAPAGQAADERTTVVIDLGTLVDPGDDGPWTVVVDWGDGTTGTVVVDEAGPIGLQSHRYLTAGTFEVTLSATDHDGVEGPSSSFQVVVEATPATPGDMDRDGLTDLVDYTSDDATGGRFEVRQTSDGSAHLVPLGEMGDIPVHGDFDGDGIIDVAVFRPNVDITGDGIADAAGWTIIESSTGSTREVLFGAPGMMDMPVSADFDGDGITDIATFRPNSDVTPGAAEWFILPSGGGSAYHIAFGAANLMDLPAPADYDGDGKADIATFRPDSDVTPGAAEWFILPSGGGSAYHIAFGAANLMDLPVPADYDGDGKADIATYRSESDLLAGSAHWFILPSSTNLGYAVATGAAGDVAAPGEYDADGRIDLATFRQDSSLWTIRDSSTEDVRTILFGTNGARTVPLLAPLASRLAATDHALGTGSASAARLAGVTDTSKALEVIDLALDELDDWRWN